MTLFLTCQADVGARHRHDRRTGQPCDGIAAAYATTPRDREAVRVCQPCGDWLTTIVLDVQLDPIGAAT